MWCQFAQEWYEITVTMPFNLESQIRQTTHASVRKEDLCKSLIFDFLQFLMVHQKELNHTCILRTQRMLILRIEVVEVLTSLIRVLLQTGF